MGFQVSPGVRVVERDLTAIIPAVATTPAGFVGLFKWGPANQIVVLSSENDLYQLYGGPDNDTYEDFYTVSNFLQYGNNIQVVRYADYTNASRAANALAALGTSTPSAPKIENSNIYSNTTSFSSDILFAAKYTGTLGNSLQIEVCDGATGFRSWGLSSQFVDAPGTSLYVQGVKGASSSAGDEIHIAIVDKLGLFSGVTGSVLEIYDSLSKATDARKSDGSSNYYKNVINNNSKYIYWTNHIHGISVGNASSTDSFGLISATAQASGGTSGLYIAGFTAGTLGNSMSVAAAEVAAGYNDYFGNPEEVDVSLLLGGTLTGNAAQIVADVAKKRMDCVAFFSPDIDGSVAANLGTYSAKSVIAETRALATRNAIGNNSYAFIDSGYKQMYDRFNDVYRWVPLNGDIAGLVVRTDETTEPWYSPAGFNRGNVKNVVQLAWNPNQAYRDRIYPKGINPVVTFPGEGTVLFGDRTAQTKPSAFDRINVRRLFIVLEKAISIAAKYQLFEFNDSFTRNMFVNMVDPFLRDIQSRRGLYGFKVICDETNNTPEVIDSNRFVADIYIKPVRSINFIQLNFIATRTGVNFEEIAALTTPGQ